ncbi:MAG: L-rhamnose isomerase [Ruminococcaceae bacterium]|nr:L-rhamnose isomerase [Oscillospiraceae bacterium]
MQNEKMIRQSYEAAAAVYAQYGVDTDAVLQQLKQLPVSMHCWQGDDVTGLERTAGGVSGGIMSTGAYPGKARNGDELRSDLDLAMTLIPGRQKINLHASYAELDGESVDRDAYETRHFSRWIAWAKERGVALDFNPTCFGHPKAADNLTLSHPDESIRRFWIDHCKASRRIAADIGKELGQPVVNNIWVPDGMKDMPADRYAYRRLLRDSLDEILAERYPAEYLLDAVECKLFGVGVESYTVGSHEFYMGYVAHARANGCDHLMLTLDMGHFHPTETIADKISSLLLFNPKLLIHVSRGVKWDSDHVVISDEQVFDVMREIKRASGFGRVYLATDFFDGSINRVAAWVIGLRATQKAILAALLEPTEKLKALEQAGRYTDRLAMMEEARSLPYTAVWDQFCAAEGVPVGADWLDAVHAYENEVLKLRQ